MEKKSIAELNCLFQNEQLTEDMVEKLEKDSRKGVQVILQRYYKQEERKQYLHEKFVKMKKYEQACHAKGFQRIAGVDEAGRGPLAGPVVAAAVILPKDFKLYGLNDSKQVNAKQRKEFYHIITKKALTYYVSAVDNRTIDAINIFEATKRAMTNALARLEPQPDYALIDAVELKHLSCLNNSLIKGDQRSISIAAASILAKVTRDEIMKDIHKEYPQYDFFTNAGYGTSSHLAQLRKYGPSPYHRQSFAPIKSMLTSWTSGD